MIFFLIRYFRYPFCLTIIKSFIIAVYITLSIKWVILDLNQGPTGYEPVALTNWANDPLYYIWLR